MRLAAVYNIWDDWGLLEKSVANIGPLVDGVFIVYSTKSNFGEESTAFKKIPGATYLNCEPDLSLPASVNERTKRNLGLDFARANGYTHFLMLDADEFYGPEQFLKEKERFKNDPDLVGLVCGLKCFFAQPDLSVSDHTLVPFIHKITPKLAFTWNTRYPFAFHRPKKEIRIDPTRQLNITDGVQWSEITMLHASWIRDDYDKKIRNSTARDNIRNSTILSDLREAKAGHYCEFYRQTLEPCSDLVKIWQNLKMEPS